MPRHRRAGAVSGGLAARWHALWERLGAAGDGDTAFRDIAGRYAEPARHYHTLEHVAECLAELDRERAGAERPDEAELALWLHDVVYDPRASDNEERSAAFAVRMLADAGIAGEVGARVAAMILATAHPDTKPDAGEAPNVDTALVCDADLAVLGAEPARYADYARRIAAEYAWVPDPVFGLRRAAVLRRFLGRDSIYASAGFRKRLEEAARRNLSAELERLGH